METTVEQRDGYHLAKFSGPLEEDAKDDFDQHLHPIVASGGRVLIDLSGVPRITSAGIGHLVTLVSRANTKSGRVVLASPSNFVKSIFHATKLERFFEIAESVDEGVEKLT